MVAVPSCTSPILYDLPGIDNKGGGRGAESGVSRLVGKEDMQLEESKGPGAEAALGIAAPPVQGRGAGCLAGLAAAIWRSQPAVVRWRRPAARTPSAAQKERSGAAGRALTGVEQDALRGGGLAGVDVGHDTDVAVFLERHLALACRGGQQHKHRWGVGAPRREVGAGGAGGSGRAREPQRHHNGALGGGWLGRKTFSGVCEAGVTSQRAQGALTSHGHHQRLPAATSGACGGGAQQCMSLYKHRGAMGARIPSVVTANTQLAGHATTG
jgi:hypothetical protein